MGTVRAIKHDQILNFLRCDETSGTSFKTEGRVVIPEATLSFPSNGLGINVAPNTALTSGTWQAPAAGSDWILMLVIDMADAFANIFTIGHSSSNHQITVSSDGNLTLVGASGQLDLIDGSPVKQVATRLLVAFDSDGNVRSGKAAEDTDLVLEEAIYAASVCGDITALDANFSGNTFGTKQVVQGFQMVEFPNGLPPLDEAVKKANWTMDQWLLGNKTYYPLYGDE